MASHGVGGDFRNISDSFSPEKMKMKRILNSNKNKEGEEMDKNFEQTSHKRADPHGKVLSTLNHDENSSVGAEKKIQRVHAGPPGFIPPEPPRSTAETVQSSPGAPKQTITVKKKTNQ